MSYDSKMAMVLSAEALKALNDECGPEAKNFLAGLKKETDSEGNTLFVSDWVKYLPMDDAYRQIEKFAIKRSDEKGDCQLNRIGEDVKDIDIIGDYEGSWNMDVFVSISPESDAAKIAGPKTEEYDLDKALDGIPDYLIDKAYHKLAVKYWMPNIGQRIDDRAEDGEKKLSRWTEKDVRAIAEEFVKYRDGEASDDTNSDVMDSLIDEHAKKLKSKAAKKTKLQG